MKKTPSSGRGEVRVKVKRNKGLKASSREWLTRQLNDPYVHTAKTEGYRSRAAFKLLELDAKFHFLRKGAKVLDLGSAPGGWSQVAAARGASVVAADVLEMEELPGVVFFKADLTDADTPQLMMDALGGPADLVLTDMAAPTTGHRETDHIRTSALVEIALEVAEASLRPGGVFVAKVFQGGATGVLLTRIKKSFRDVKHVKPPASRSDSVELYMVASGFRNENARETAPVLAAPGRQPDPRSKPPVKIGAKAKSKARLAKVKAKRKP